MWDKERKKIFFRKEETSIFTRQYRAGGRPLESDDDDDDDDDNDNDNDDIAYISSSKGFKSICESLL